MTLNQRCPTSEDLLRAAVSGGDALLGGGLAGHVRDCSLCALELAELRQAAQWMRAGSLVRRPAPEPCLDAARIAAVVDGIAAHAEGSVIEHLASCDRCRAELAAATRLVRDSSVAREIARVEPARPEGRGLHRRWRAGVAVLAAAGLVGLSFATRSSRESPEAGDAMTLREHAITTTGAPRILEPLGAATAADSLRWTGVPRADLYRVTVWDRGGAVVWEGETRDTVVALTGVLDAARDDALLWEVRARTGWDRWVASELAEILVRGQRRNPR